MNKNQEVANRLNGWKLSKRAARIIGATEIDLMDEIFGKFETPEDVEEMISQNYIHGIKNEKTYILRNLRAMGQTEEYSGADLHEDNVYTGKELAECLKDLTEEDGETLTLDVVGELDPEGLYYWVDEYIFEIEEKSLSEKEQMEAYSDFKELISAEED